MTPAFLRRYLGVTLVGLVWSCGGKSGEADSTQPAAQGGAAPTLACVSSAQGGASPNAAVTGLPATAANGEAGTRPTRLLPSPDCHHPRVEPNCRQGFCRIEPGCFILGEPRDEFTVARYASVQIQVTLTHPFWIGQTEVTREQWESVGWSQPVQYRADDGTTECREPDCPQGNVSFYDVLSFTNRYSEIRGLPPCYELVGCAGEVGNGLRCSQLLFLNDSIYDCTGYRLPMEAEWEYAARAGTTTAFYSGDITPQIDSGCYPDPALDLIGWYCANSDRRSHPAAQKEPNCWGLFDMSGNVDEWCNDIFSPEGYGTSPQTDPLGTLTRGRDITVLPAQLGRIKRGSYYSFMAWAHKSGWRGSDDDFQFDVGMGFRLVRTAQPDEK